MIILQNKKLAVLVMIGVAMITMGLGCKGGSKDALEAIQKPVHLNFWGVFDSQDAYAGVIAEFQKTRPNVSITYRKLQFAEYEQALLEAWAEGRGPDIVMIHNTWVGDYVNKLKPLPPTIKVPSVELQGTFKKEYVPVIKDVPTISQQTITNSFIDVVGKDIIRGGNIYGLPLAVDTMVLYYNRSILDQSGVPSPPKTWQEVKEASQAITKLDEEGNIIRSGIALGGAKNINRSFDIVSLLMAQNGTEFTTPDGSEATFARRSPLAPEFSPGQEALRFYTDFAHPGKEVYTWSEDLPSAFESFVGGKLGMMIGYAFQLPLLKAQGPKINYGIVPVPHINADGTDSVGESVNWANYWLLSAAQATENQNEVWDFIQFVTTKPDVAKKYLANTSKPTALRSLVPEQISNPDTQPFAQQLLTAQSWYRGNDANIAEQAFNTMIRSVTSGIDTPETAIKRAQGAIDQTLR